MKVLDTPLLVDLLRGRIASAELQDAAAGEELATTELNIYELERLARAGPRVGRERRVAVLQQLRHRLTVLPIDEKAIHLAASAEGRVPAGPPLEWIMMAAARSAGAREWWTSGGGPSAELDGLKVRKFGLRKSPHRKERD